MIWLGASSQIAQRMAVRHAAPATTPADRVAALRATFAKTDEVAALVNKIVNASPELVERVKKAISGRSEERTEKKT